jgi:hypothetical protein
MRIYLIANDGITLCPEMPAAMCGASSPAL